MLTTVQMCPGQSVVAMRYKDSIPDGITGNDIIPMPHYDPRIDSASNRNEHQKYFLGVKTAVA